MNQIIRRQIIILIAGFISFSELSAQEISMTLEECIDYAINNSTSMGRAVNEVKSQESILEKAQAAIHPDLYFSGSESFSTANRYNETGTTGEWNREGHSGLNLSLSTGVTLYNGAKLKNSVLRSRLDLAAAESEIQTRKDILSLDILTAYINVLYSEEQVRNSKAILEATEKQLEQAGIRREAGVLSPADYLNIKSQHATDRATLISSESNLRVSRVSLMQIMNMPVSENFSISFPDTDSLVLQKVETNASIVYGCALGLQPSIKTAALELESAGIDIEIARADIQPVISLNAGLSSMQSSDYSNLNFATQLSHQVTPSVGLNFSVPIYQRKQVKNNITQAQIAADNIQYNLTDTKNNLRKAIEQACTDVQTAKSAFSAGNEQLEAQKESYRVSEEMFIQGMINAVDYLTAKNNLTSAETSLTRAKYTLILQNRLVAYYMGETIGFGSSH